MLEDPFHTIHHILGFLGFVIGSYSCWRTFALSKRLEQLEKDEQGILATLVFYAVLPHSRVWRTVFRCIQKGVDD